MSPKRRTLVLQDESARHPFLASLPPHVRRIEDDDRPQRRFDLRSWRDFMAAYCACFAAVLTFIA